MEINEPQRLELSGCFFLRRPKTKKQCLWKQELWSEKTRPIAFAFRYFMLKHFSKSFRTEKKSQLFAILSYPPGKDHLSHLSQQSGRKSGRLNGREGRMLFPKKAHFPKFWSMEAERFFIPGFKKKPEKSLELNSNTSPASWNC